MMNCPNCNTLHKDSAHFCRSCGAKLAVPEAVAVQEKEIPFQAPLPETPPAAPISYEDFPEETPEENGRGLFGLLVWIHVVILFSYLLQHYIFPAYNSGNPSGGKWVEYAGYITEGITLLFLVVLMVKVKNSSWKLGLFMFLVIRAGIGCFEYTSTHKSAGVPEVASAQEHPVTKSSVKAAHKAGKEPVLSAANGPYKITGMQGYMYYNSSRAVGEDDVIGKLSENIVDNSKLDLRNTVIGGGDAAGISNQTMVVVDITGKKTSEYIARKVRLTVTSAEGQLFKQTQDLAIISEDGKYKAAFLLYETGNTAITLKAQIINVANGKEIVESTLTKSIDFYIEE
ncbi:MAG: zinc ribbon domain-containing protein [Chitinophaga sp.]|uniref:zinc ribbon domain-containing protein n=1 Tax=Chitinophaga sp. TaxID=1869181 RepID=UPI001B11825F|nr:zinc ribbon domain-containing protein [Chitinophaga sp.]MBO9729653.1 zinc ribbon domain-containing protein [Chitinophaga sp.]